MSIPTPGALSPTQRTKEAVHDCAANVLPQYHTRAQEHRPVLLLEQVGKLAGHGLERSPGRCAVA